MRRGSGTRPGLVALRSMTALVALMQGSGGALAQTTVNSGALDLLPARPAPAPRAAPRPVPPHTGTAKPASPRPGTRTPAVPQAAVPGATPAPATPALAAAGKPAIPTVPPAVAALPPAAPVPATRPMPTSVAPVAADAPGAAVRQAGGLRITFGPGREELNADTEAALRELAHGMRGGTGGVTLLAYAAGSPDNPSVARRLSLQRALAARAVLVNEGVASNRIYPRALGNAGGDAEPDRVDLVPQPASGATP